MEAKGKRLSPGRRVHMVGIGGIGLSAIARILLDWGVEVSGSDLQRSAVTDELAAQGARIVQGHAAENIGEAEFLVISSAVPESNAEVAEARRRGLPVLKRADIMGEMMAGRYGIAVAGTAGKTTTTAMISHVLVSAGLDPTYIVGGIIGGAGTNARSGHGPHFVIEADEYDGMFLGLRPTLAVITHLEADHPDCYPTLADMVSAFRRFLALVPAHGGIVFCMDEPHVRELATATSGPAVTGYGLGADQEWRAIELARNLQGGTSFAIQHNGKRWAEVELAVPGEHNVKNALGAAVACSLAGVDRQTIVNGLSSFSGVLRRFEKKGRARGVEVIDDYAHHPTKIEAALSAARQQYPESRIWAVFQPHTFSRTHALFSEFAASLSRADEVLVLDIYAAREHDDLGMHSTQLAAAMRAGDRAVSARYCESFDSAVEILNEETRAGDVVITLGAGDGYLVGERLLDALAGRVRA